MATVVKKNKRSQDEIRQGLGFSSGNNVSRSAANPTSGNIGMVRPTSGTGAAPAGWYGNNKPANPTPSTSQLQGMPNAPIGFGAPSEAVSSIIGQAPQAEAPSNDVKSNSAGFMTYRSQSAPERAGFVRREFTPSSDTEEYYDMMKGLEEDRPGPFQSKYEGTIQTILDGILNRKSFDLQSDANYNLLYNQAKEKYMTQGNRAMRDTMGAMQAATGGYGSTAATAAAGQAYDRYMEGLNDQNTALAQLAYQIYGDENADRYNQLGTVTGLDATDYSRHRDDVGDWQADRAYAANQYQNFFGNDMAQYQFETGMDWDAYKDAASRDWEEYTYGDQRDYQRERDKKADYDAAFNRALSLAQSGMGIPANYGDQLEPETLQQLNALAAQVQAQKALAAAGGSGGGRGGRSGRGNGKSNGGGYDQASVTNWNDDSQVAVTGFGRMSWTELQKHVTPKNKGGYGDIEEIYNKDKNTYTYRKKR